MWYRKIRHLLQILDKNRTIECVHHKQLTNYKRCIVIKTLQSNTEFERHNRCTVILLQQYENYLQRLPWSDIFSFLGNIEKHVCFFIYKIVFHFLFLYLTLVLFFVVCFYHKLKLLTPQMDPLRNQVLQKNWEKLLLYFQFVFVLKLFYIDFKWKKKSQRIIDAH